VVKTIENISEIFRKKLRCNKARADLIACFLVSLIKVRTVNLTEIASAMPGKVKQSSKYRRLKRFFEKFEFHYRRIAVSVAEMIPSNEKKWEISMDRTNWKLGEKNINPLVMGIVRFGVAFPIRWTTFSKRGNSNTEERIRLIEWFEEVFGIEKIECLYADREFVGEKWIGHLLNKNIHFCIRIRENFLVSNSTGRQVPVKNMFGDLKPNRYSVLPGKRKINGLLLNVVGTMLPNGERLILVTDKNPDRALENYKKRWGIETLFQCLKKRGFNFEDTRMTFPERIDKLIALLAIAFAWCHITGEWRNERKKIKIKKHGRKEISLFRYGLNYIRQILLNFHENRREFQAIVVETLQYRLLRNSKFEISR
jgi:hypothetical protein